SVRRCPSRRRLRLPVLPRPAPQESQRNDARPARALTSAGESITGRLTFAGEGAFHRALTFAGEGATHRVLTFAGEGAIHPVVAFAGEGAVRGVLTFAGDGARGAVSALGLARV